MNVFAATAGVVFMGILAFQDFKWRKISWILLPLLFFSLIASGVRSLSIRELAFYFAVNLSFIVLQVGILTIYFSLKKKKLTNIVNQYIGIGDLLFFIAICAAFSPINFIIFYSACMLLSLLSILVYHFISGKSIKEIPLAGIFSIALIAVFGFHNLIPDINLYNDQLLLSIF